MENRVKVIRANRVMVQLDDVGYHQLVRIASVHGVSLSRVMSDTWRAAAPMLMQLADLVEQSEKAKDDVKQKIRDELKGALVEMYPKASDLVNDLGILSGSVNRMLEGSRKAEEEGTETGVRAAHIT
jgi:hypothetical protein